jgi:hypothetical protein
VRVLDRSSVRLVDVLEMQVVARLAATTLQAALGIERG